MGIYLINNFANLVKWPPQPTLGLPKLFKLFYLLKGVVYYNPNFGFMTKCGMQKTHEAKKMCLGVKDCTFISGENARDWT
jgi:hypothetical protein